MNFMARLEKQAQSNFDGWDAWFMSSNVEALRAIRLKPSQKTILFNGPPECLFCKYEMCAGSEEAKDKEA